MLDWHKSASFASSSFVDGLHKNGWGRGLFNSKSSLKDWIVRADQAAAEPQDHVFFNGSFPTNLLLRHLLPAELKRFAVSSLMAYSSSIKIIAPKIPAPTTAESLEAFLLPADAAHRDDAAAQAEVQELLRQRTVTDWYSADAGEGEGGDGEGGGGGRPDRTGSLSDWYLDGQKRPSTSTPQTLRVTLESFDEAAADEPSQVAAAAAATAA
mmetsp:Transcript_63658/g.179160  ORF Transcript_63658/g.179160 Transcript_63658/m.179160 type:complete len:211 (+) Transcript_63658:69-701(+)